MGYFTGCALKIRITFIQNLVLVTWKTKFYRKSKAFFIHISSIASFKPFFWLSGGGNIALFRTVPWLTLSPRLGPKYNQYGTIFPKKSSSTTKLFSSSNMLFIRLFLANTEKKNRGLPGLIPHKLPWMWSWIRRSLSRWRISAVGTGTRHKMALMLCTEKVVQCKTRESP